MTLNQPEHLKRQMYSTPPIPKNLPQWTPFDGQLIAASPLHACDIESLENADALQGNIVLIDSCTFDANCY